MISRTSAFRYKQREIEPQKVAKELGVEALVTGRVIQRGDDLSVSAELVDAREDKQLWGEQYSRKLADIVVSPAGDRNSYIWKSAGTADQRREDAFGEAVRGKS